tara:strand:- start:4846 stop:5055 length:210 start_codon:yes stop_codon:yes gene_type:complete
MKNLSDSLKQKLVSKYIVSDSSQTTSRSTDINLLLNRVKSNKKQEVRNKFYFSAAASTCLILFGAIVFS